MLPLGDVHHDLVGTTQQARGNQKSRDLRCSRCPAHLSRAEGIQSRPRDDSIAALSQSGLGIDRTKRSTTVPRVNPGHLIHAPNRLALEEAPSARAKEDTRSETGDEQTYLSRWWGDAVVGQLRAFVVEVCSGTGRVLQEARVKLGRDEEKEASLSRGQKRVGRV